MSNDLRLRVLGPFAAHVAGAPVTIGARKGRAILAYLSRRADRAAPRETLTALLWADSADEQARASLRQTLSGLKREMEAAGHSGFQADASTVALVSSTVVDADRLDAPLTDLEEMAEIEARCGGVFLEGFGPLTPEFDRWLDAERGHLRQRLAELRLRLCDGWFDSGQIDAGIAVAQRILAEDPLQEQVHRRLMRAFLRQNRPDAALRQFDIVRKMLARELDVQPEPETAELAAEIRRHRSARAPAHAPAPAAEPAPEAPLSEAIAAPTGTTVAHRPAIAVLPFRSLSGGEEAALFAEGLAEEVIVELAREKGILVVARASSFQIDETAQAAGVIADRLGVGFLLTGSVRIMGQAVRVTAQLVDARTGSALWAERYDRSLAEVFAIQSEIARTVTATTIGRISAAEAESAAGRPFDRLEAATLVAQGQRHFMAYSCEGFERASACFQRAIELDPHYARAYGLDAIARILIRWAFNVNSDVADILPTAGRAVELDERDAKGHCALGIGNLILRNYEKAAHHFGLGLRFNPNDDLLLIEYARFLIYVDQPAEGLEKVREAMRLNPFHPNYYLQLEARCLHTLGRHAEALEVFARLTDPPFWIMVYVELCHRALGDEDAARSAHDAYLARTPGFDIAAFKATFPFRNPASAEHFFAGLIPDE